MIRVYYKNKVIDKKVCFCGMVHLKKITEFMIDNTILLFNTRQIIIRNLINKNIMDSKDFVRAPGTLYNF